jgi:cobalt-zinc-cadmium efflux system protein
MRSVRQSLPVVSDRPQAPDQGAAPSERTSGITRPAGFTARERHQIKRLVAVMLITAVFFVAQLAGAIWADSDVLKLEAVHVLTDVAALGLAALAMHVAIRRPTTRFTFGLRRVEPVAAIFNALLVLGATCALVWNAVADLGARGGGPEPDRMLYVAMVGLVVNGISAWLIHGAIGKDHDHEERATPDPPGVPCEDYDHHHIAHHAHREHGHVLNLRGAWLHLFGDALGSLAAGVAAVAIRFGASPKLDAIASFVVAAILVYGSVRLLYDAILVLLEAAPPHLGVDRVRAAILGTAGVAELHELHVWALGAGHDAISAHVRAKSGDSSLSSRIEATLRQRFRVEYVTIQVEVGGVTCQTDTIDP